MSLLQYVTYHLSIFQDPVKPKMSQVKKGHGLGDIRRSLVTFMNCRSDTTLQKQPSQTNKQNKQLSSMAGVADSSVL